MDGVVFLIGGTGFAGTHARRLFESRYHVAATGRGEDIRESKKMRNLVEKVKPQLVINLAAITTVQESIDRVDENYQTSFFGTLNLLTALKEFGFKGRMLYVSSSEVYGYPTPEHLPLKENAPLRPMNPYAVGKVAAEALCYQWSQTGPFEVVVARPFTHFGPGQSERFSISNFAKQIAEIMLGKREAVIHVGNLENGRDFNDVRDVVRGYEAVLKKGRNGCVYNVCSGKENSTRVLLDLLINLSGLDIKVLQEETLMRKKEASTIKGSSQRLREETGWRTEIPIETTLKDTLDFWVKKLKQG